MYSMNVYQNNLMLMLLIAGIAVIPVLIALDRFFAPKHYPLAVFVITLALFYHTSLISNYVWGWDINHEYALAQAVLQNSLWNPYIADNMNAMLSVTILPVIYARICALSLTWVFKIVYPFICALVPLGMFLVFEKQTDRKTSFFATFFFVSLYSFFVEQAELARQEVALLFLILFVLLIEDRVLTRMKASALLLVFSTALVVSHYGITYLFLICLIGAFLVQAISNSRFLQRGSRKHGARSKVSRTQVGNGSVAFSTAKNRDLSARLVLLVFVTTFAWYLYVGSASPLSSIVVIGGRISNTVFGSGPSQTPEGLAALAGVSVTPLYQLARYVRYCKQPPHRAWFTCDHSAILQKAFQCNVRGVLRRKLRIIDRWRYCALFCKWPQYLQTVPDSTRFLGSFCGDRMVRCFQGAPQRAEGPIYKKKDQGGNRTDYRSS